MGGSIRLYVIQEFVDLGTSFEFISVRIDGTDNEGTIIPSIPISTLKIEKLVYSLS